MMRQISTPLLLMVTVAAVLWGVTRGSQRPDRAGRLADETRHRDELLQLRLRISRLEAERADLRRRLPAAASPGIAAPSSPAAAAEMTEVGPSPVQRTQSPSATEDTVERFRDVMRVQQSVAVERQVARLYGDLLDEFDLPAEEREEFIELLKKRRLAEILSPVDMLGDHGLALNPERLSDINETRRAEAQNVDDDIRRYLTEEAYARYEYHRDSRWARGEVDEVQRQLAAQDLPLSPAQRQGLVDVFYHAQGGADGNPESDPMQNLRTLFQDPAELNAAINDNLDSAAGAYNRVLQASRDTLDDDQHAALENHFQQMLQQQENQAEITVEFAPLFQGLMKGTGMSGP